MDTNVAKAWVLMLFQMLEATEVQNEALRVVAKRHGVQRKELQVQLDELQEDPAIKKRVRATISPTRKRIEVIFGEIASKETLAGLPVTGRKIQ